MKQITFQGNTYEVPDWATYIAKDDSGLVYAYEQQPRFSDEHKEWRQAAGQYEFIGNVNCVKIN